MQHLARAFPGEGEGRVHRDAVFERRVLASDAFDSSKAVRAVGVLVDTGDRPEAVVCLEMGLVLEGKLSFLGADVDIPLLVVGLPGRSHLVCPPLLVLAFTEELVVLDERHPHPARRGRGGSPRCHIRRRRSFAVDVRGFP